MHRQRFVVRSFLCTLAAGLIGVGALVGCELAVQPDVGLAEIPAQPCLPCLDDADTVVTEPDGNVVIVPTSSLADDAGDDEASAAAGDALADH